MAFVLLMLILQVTLGRDGFIVAAIVLQVLTMTAPRLFRPAAVVWLGLSHPLGAVMSRILLGVVFFGLVTPIGLLRRALGKDALRLRAFKANRESVLVARDHTFAPGDLEKPY
jgi:hypothetical protein